MPVSSPESAAEEPQAIRDELLRHLDAAYNVARWLSGNEHDASDILQESFLRAVRACHQCRGGNTRAWLLRIVRNTCHTWLTRNRTRAAPLESLDQEPVSESDAPDVRLERRLDAGAVRAAIELLPEELGEVIVLREIEGMAYKEIAEVVGIPVGTVMSRLSRARERLKELLAGYRAEVCDEL